MKIFKTITYFCGFANSFNPHVVLEQTQLNQTIAPRANTVGFRGDTVENKRIITWSGDEVRMKFTTDTQQGSNQFCIWNEWYFLASEELLVKKDNLNYNDYNSWKCLNFWGDDSKFQNSHNIKNELIIPNVQHNNQGFYNLQYNYRTGGTLGIQNHIFSSLPFHLIVVPKITSVNISPNTFDLKYGESLNIYSTINKDNNNLSEYINSGILSIDYIWETFNGDEWITLANKSNKIENLLLEPGHHKFQLSIKASIIHENNALNPPPITFKSNIIEINVNQNLKISEPEIKFLGNNLQSQYYIYYNDELTLDKNVIDYAWYRFNSQVEDWELYTNENKILIDLSTPNEFCFKAKTLNGLESIVSNTISVKPAITQNKLNVNINDFNFTNGYQYSIYDTSNQIIAHHIVDANIEFVYDFESYGKYKILIKDNIGNLYCYDLNLEESIIEEIPEKPDVDAGSDENHESSTPFYKQTWFYILISTTIGIFILLILWLVYKKIKNKS